MHEAAQAGADALVYVSHLILKLIYFVTYLVKLTSIR